MRFVGVTDLIEGEDYYQDKYVIILLGYKKLLHGMSSAAYSLRLIDGGIYQSTMFAYTPFSTMIPVCKRQKDGFIESISWINPKDIDNYKADKKFNDKFEEHLTKEENIK